MSCRSCQSEHQAILPSEINIHFPGRKNLEKRTVWAFSELMVCLDCGFVEFLLQKDELYRLAEGSRGRT